MFSVLRRRDLLVQHPYESFSESTDTFIRQASEDPQVQAIKLTLYRTSGDSPIIASLIRAAEAGKQVVALVELKARFDEANNIEWARRLERAGVHVVYGLVGLKTHTKVVLVARAEGDGVRCYCHIGTGNYNERTARLYEDCAVFTSADDVATDVQRLFNVLTGYSREAGYRRLLVAPEHLRSGFIELIRGERAAPPGTGAIIMKMNSLADPALIDELYAASSDGVRIQLIVRGICCLRPGVPGLSEHITVRSIVGRYLEHSRVFRFANGSGPGRPLTYLGSADLMPRNLDRRVEALVAVADPASQRRLDEILRITLDDDVRAWELHNDVWERVAERGEREAQVELHELARTQASGRRRVRWDRRARRRRPRARGPPTTAERLVTPEGPPGTRRDLSRSGRTRGRGGNRRDRRGRRLADRLLLHRPARAGETRGLVRSHHLRRLRGIRSLAPQQRGRRGGLARFRRA